MGLAAVSGGLLIAFTFIILILVIVCIAIVRFKSPEFYTDSKAAKMYREVFRTVLLIIVGATVALTVAIPRWTRSSPSFADAFIGMGMFETCACSDPAAFCNEAAGFRAVQGFSVLGLLGLAGIAIISAVAASMKIEEETAGNTAHPPSISGSGGVVATSPAAGSSSSPANHQMNTSASSAAASAAGGGSVIVGEGNATGDGGEPQPTSENPVAAAAQPEGTDSSLPELLCMILVVFSWFSIFLAWVVFAGRNLSSACNGATLYNLPFTGGNLGWGWVFRFFEWLLLTIIAVLFISSVKGWCILLDFTSSRLHIASLLLFCMSCLSSTTPTWSTADVGFTYNNATIGSGTSSVGAFFACRCSTTFCAVSKETQDAAIAFYLLFFFFFVPRAFYVLTHTAVWKHALQPIYNCCDSCGLSEKIDNIKAKFSAKLSGIISGIFGLLIPIFLLVAVVLTTGVLASGECGLDNQSADFGLIFCVMALFLCGFEGFVAFLDGVFPVGGFPDEPASNDEDANNNNNGAVGDGDDNNNNNNKSVSNMDGTPKNVQFQPQSPGTPNRQNNLGTSGGEAEFSNVVMAPPPPPPPPQQQNSSNTPTPRSNKKNYAASSNNNDQEMQPQSVSPSRMSPATENGGLHNPPPPPPPPPPRIQAQTVIAEE